MDVFVYKLKLHRLPEALYIIFFTSVLNKVYFSVPYCDNKCQVVLV